MVTFVIGVIVLCIGFIMVFINRYNHGECYWIGWFNVMGSVYILLAEIISYFISLIFGV